jgi:hypothetical protein
MYYLGGDSEAANKAKIAGNGYSFAATVYGPYTDVEIGGNGTLIGAVVAHYVDIHGNGGVQYDAGVTGIGGSTLGVYRQEKFVECTPIAPGSEPDSGC